MVRIDLVLTPIDGQVAEAKFDHCSHVNNLHNSIEDSDRLIERNGLRLRISGVERYRRLLACGIGKDKRALC